MDDDLLDSMTNKSFSFIEAPLYQGQKNRGVSLGPAFLRQALTDQKFNFTSQVATGSQSKQRINFKIYEELSYLVEREVRRGQLPFIAGGDHSLSIGSIQGLLRYFDHLKVIWVDAHGDINTKKTSQTGAFHGMPLAYLLGLEREEGELWMSHRLKPENLIYFGVRDLDAAEKEFLERYRIRYFTAQQIQSESDDIIRFLSSHCMGAKVFFSIDADAFDPALAPSTGVPVQNGLSFQIVRELVRRVSLSAQVVGLEYVELNPQIFKEVGDVERTAQIGIDLFSEVLNHKNREGIFYGRDDRFSHSEGSDLLHTAF